jgi:hypothetical protein
MDCNFNGYDRIYHHHIMKCAGTTLNGFLELQVHHAQVQPALSVDQVIEIQANARSLYPEIEDLDSSENRAILGTIIHDRLYRHMFDHYRVIREHASLHEFCKGKTFRFTVLREPGARVLSQLRQWQLLTPEQFDEFDKSGRHYMRDAITLPPLEFMQKHLGSPQFPELDNFMVRTLAAVTLGQTFACYPLHPSAGMLNYAVRNLVHHFELVFTQENFDAGFQALCACLGLCPQLQIASSNITKSPSKDSNPIEPTLQELFHERLAPDYVLYNVALDWFQLYQETHPDSYNRRQFEVQHVQARLSNLIPQQENDCVWYDLNQPVIGSGFWSREGAGTSECSLWSGPAPISSLYMPAPRGERISLLVVISGFARPEFESQLQVQVDGRPREFHLLRREDGFYHLRIPHVPVRDFVHLQLELPHTVTDTADSRARGWILRKYGWRMFTL